MLRNFLLFIVLSGALLLVSCAVNDADNERQRAEIQQLIKNQAAIQEELLALRALVEQQGPARRGRPVNAVKELDVSGINFLGYDAAPLTIIEFTDYECPFCRRHAKNTLPLLIDKYINTGKVKYGIIDFPLEQIHPRALRLAEFALCAGNQGKYWAMHDELLALAPATADSARSLANKLDLNDQQFSTCLASEQTASAIRENLSLGWDVGVKGTPHFLIGRSADQESNKFAVSSAFSGARPISQFDSHLDRLSQLLSPEKTGVTE